MRIKVSRDTASLRDKQEKPRAVITIEWELVTSIDQQQIILINTSAGPIRPVAPGETEEVEYETSTDGLSRPGCGCQRSG